MSENPGQRGSHEARAPEDLDPLKEAATLRGPDHLDPGGEMKGHLAQGDTRPLLKTPRVARIGHQGNPRGEIPLEGIHHLLDIVTIALPSRRSATRDLCPEESWI
ncbi:hypothetical protein A2U01_0069077, partial [Trifolium medium]|nr:hypothetical protein [Trifolium medium]